LSAPSPSIWGARQDGTFFEVLRDGVIVARAPVSILTPVAEEISSTSDAVIMDWHCIGAVALFLRAIERCGWDLRASDRDIRDANS
jgi:hypothetical protein